MSIAELSNSPIQLTLAGKTYKIKRLSVSDIYGKAQAKVVEEYRNNIKDIAKDLIGADKTNYLTSATKDIPRGEILNNLANEWLNSPLGMAEILFIGLSKYQEVTQDEVAEAIIKSTDEERQILMSYLSGSDADKSDTASNVSPDDKKK